MNLRAKYHQVVIEQRKRDESLCSLMETIRDIHSFLLDAKTLEIIHSHRTTFKVMGDLTVICAHLIERYTQDDSFCMSLSIIS